MTGKRGLKAPVRLRQLISQIEEELDTADNLVRARIAHQLVEECRRAQEVFGESRTSALQNLRDEGWSLGDLAEEFQITRARVSQIACRDRYKSGVSRGGGYKRDPR